MKYMIISDIHGDIYKLNQVLDIYYKEKCDKLIILGDLFSYGYSYDREDIVNRLNNMKNSIIAVRGNCDNNINDILFDMPYISNIVLNNYNITLTHGHMFSNNYLLNLDSNIIFKGHSHIASIDIFDNKVIINPGSISKARNGIDSFVIMNLNSITIRDLNNQIIDEYILKHE